MLDKIKLLRDETGYQSGISKSLTETNGDTGKARELARSRGGDIATKRRAENSSRSGGCLRSNNKLSGCMLNCFVKLTL